MISHTANENVLSYLVFSNLIHDCPGAITSHIDRTNNEQRVLLKAEWIAEDYPFLTCARKQYNCIFNIILIFTQISI